MVDKETKDKLLDLIRKSREQELLFLRTVHDAAILAGEQVQDKRLDFLDHPPDVNATPFLVDFLISLTLSLGASAVIKSFVSRGLQAILRNRGLAFEETTSKIVSIEKKLYIPKHLARDILDQKKAEYDLWTRFAEKIQKIGEVGADVAAKRLQQPNTSQENNHLAGDTASVAVRRAALSFVRLQEPVVVLIHEHYRNLVESGGFEFAPEVFIRFLNNNLKFPKLIKTKANSELERSLSLFFEACIWLMHFEGSSAMAEKAKETEYYALGDEFVYNVIEETTLTSKKPIVRYWLFRFPHPNGNGTESFGEYSIMKDVGNYPDNAITDLINWFKNIEDGIVNLQQLGVVGLEVFGPVKPK